MILNVVETVVGELIRCIGDCLEAEARITGGSQQAPRTSCLLEGSKWL